ncbi:hypothetical protein [Kordiimonas aestuarii]|uniref:hypothetical protein n=1 Tax=Kordiimonas aestuarii TaxID=1005925 RepID=UPI0021CE3FC3|nr:hypothetical protein [Kordiimonas aestuarii]
MTGGNLSGRIQRMLAMLNAGEFMPVFDEFYRHNARFYENEFLFAESAGEARERQANFIETCDQFTGNIELVHTDLGRGITVFYNRSSYEHADYGSGKVNGVHVLYWQGDMIAREEYFSGDRVEEMLKFWRLVGRSAGR